MPRTWMVLSLFALSCAAPPASPAPPRAATSRPVASGSAPPSPVPAPALVPSSSSSGALAPRPPLPPSKSHVLERLLDANATFLVTGEDGRIAILADERGAVVPHRYERGAWQRLPLPDSQKATTTGSSIGIYFGRDDRPRLMGHRELGGARKMVYLRFRDGAWQDQRTEVGSLAGDGSMLFGVLGEADPEVVCKVGGICLLKSRKGWKELPNTIPPSAVVRVFGGKGYALTDEGVFRADDGGFVRVGPVSSWKSAATGFWVGADGAVVVVEPGAGLVHRWEPSGSSWQIDLSPIAAPRDVGGPPEDRWICGDGGLAHGRGAAFERVGGAELRLSRWIATPTGGLVGGPSGVFAIGPAAK